jgi:hypothetical protein
MKDSDKVTVAWCDNGFATGSFAEGLLSATVVNKNISDFIRFKGVKISTQRQLMFDEWIYNRKSEWMLWIDSDIVVNDKIITDLFDSADENTYPVIGGMCFTFFGKDEDGYTVPQACFALKDEKDSGQILAKIPENILDLPEIIEVHATGFGLLLVHRSVGEKLIEDNGFEHIFNEIHFNHVHDGYIGEDTVFCGYVKQSGFPIHVNTRVVPKHDKLIELDEKYHELFFNRKKKIDG